MSNSAHDDIRLTIEEQHIELYRQRLDACPVGQRGDASALLRLIADLGKAADHGDACVEVRTMRLDHASKSLWLEFDVQVLKRAGWLDVLPPGNKHYLDENRYRELRSAFDESDFDLDFRMPEPSHLLFSELLDSLDHLRIGRPSTLGITLENMEKSGMLSLEGDEVRLGTEAYQLLQAMQQRYPGMASKHFSTRLALLQSQLEQSSISIGAALAELLPDVLGHVDSAALAERVWDDIESLYDSEDQVPHAPTQGLIRRSVEHDS